MSSDPAPQHLGRTWAEVEAGIKEYRAAADAAVVRWAWGPNFAGWERLEPLYVERVHREPAKTGELPEPEDRTTRDLFGFDAAGWVVVARQFQNWPREGIQSETILVDGADGPVQLVMRDWGDATELLRIDVPVFDGDRIASITWYRRDYDRELVRHSEHYTYERDRPVRVDIDAWDDDGSRVQHVEWDDDGEIRRIYTDSGNERFVGYVRPPKGGIGPIRRRVEAELIERIAAWADRSTPDEAVWALAILYDTEGNPPLPPSLGLAVDADRDDDPLVRFNPAEWRFMDAEPEELGGGAFAEDCAVLNQHWGAARDDAAPRRLFVKVAKALRDRDWTGALRLADDFEVLPVDLELEDLERNRRALRPKRQ
jgi:hypothetical protein